MYFAFFKKFFLFIEWLINTAEWIKNLYLQKINEAKSPSYFV